MRFYDLQQGAIRIDGVDFGDGADALRAASHVLPGSILVLWNHRAEHTAWHGRNRRCDHREGATEVNGADFIRTLRTNSRKRFVSGASNTLNGAEQLISFTRALAHEPKILILDEANIERARDRVPRRDALSRMIGAEGRTSIIRGASPFAIQRSDKIIRDAQRARPRDGQSPATAHAARHLLEALPAAI